jgi:hypothetical protein
MGIKSTMAAVSYAANHLAAAKKAGQDVLSVHAEAQLQCVELLRTLNLLLSTMQTGDGNITTLQAQITALS